MNYAGGLSQRKLYFDGAIDVTKRIRILMFFGEDISVRLICFLFGQIFCVGCCFSRCDEYGCSRSEFR